MCPRNAWTKRRSDGVVLLWDKLLAQQPRRLCERFPWFYLGHTSTKFNPQRFGIPVPTSNGRYLVTCCTNDVGMMGIHFKLSQNAHGDLSRPETYTPQLPSGHRQPTMSKSLAEYKQPPDATRIHCLKIGHPKNLRINLTLLSSALLDGNCETGMAITISCAVVDSISGATNAENNINEWFNHSTYQLLSSTLKPSETKSIYIYYIYIWWWLLETVQLWNVVPYPWVARSSSSSKPFPWSSAHMGPKMNRSRNHGFQAFQECFKVGENDCTSCIPLHAE